MKSALHAMTSPFGKEYPPGFTVGHCGYSRRWHATLPDGTRIDFPAGAEHRAVQDWCWEQHRRLQART